MDKESFKIGYAAQYPAPLICQKRGHFRYSFCKFAHGPVGGESVARRIRQCPGIQAAELMQPYQIETVYKPVAAGTCGMVIIKESPAALRLVPLGDAYNRANLPPRAGVFLGAVETVWE